MKLTKENYRDYLLTTYAAWLGKVIGVRLGSPVEGWSSAQIEETFHGKSGYLVDYDIYAADDDTNGPLFFVRPLLDKKDISAADVGNAFLQYLQEYMGFFWWGGVGISTEHTAYENLKNGIKAPLSGAKETNGIAIAEQIGGQIFSDCWGYVSGGNPQQAKKLAAQASSVSHDANGIQGGIFVATAIALAYEEKDIYQVIQKAMAYLDPQMEYYQKIQIIMDFYRQHPDDWHACLQFIQENYGYDKYPGVCHIIPNLCVMIMGLCYGQGDFTKTLTIANQAGWDTDCNVGNLGSILGALVGLEGIDPAWITPINDVVNASSAIGYLNIQTVSASAKMFAKLAYQLQGIDLEDDEQFDLPYATQGFRSDEPLTVENSRLIVNGTAEVYNYSYYRGQDLYDSRYDPSFSPLLYPHDTVEFDLESVKENRVRIFVEEADGKREYSDSCDANGTIRYQIGCGVNKTVLKYGLELTEGEGGYAIKWVKRIHQPRWELDFRSYPIDGYGPRYAGDTLYNLRGWVFHSGQWQVDDQGLHIQCQDHFLTSTGIPFNVKHMEVEFEGDNLLLVYAMKDALTYQAVGIQQGRLVKISRNPDGTRLTEIADAIENTGKYHFNFDRFDDKMVLYLNGRVFDAADGGQMGLIGLASEMRSTVSIRCLKAF